MMCPDFLLTCAGIACLINRYMYSAKAVAWVCRLMIGSIERPQMQQTKAFDFGKDAAESMRARATFNQVV